MRGAFAGGVLASMCLYYPAENFDMIVGVSAGACVAAFYITEENAAPAALTRFMNVWRYEIIGSKFISVRNFLRGKSFMNLDYLVDHLFGEKYRMNRERLDHLDAVPLYVGVTNMKSGTVEYLRATSENLLPLLKTAISVPLATRGKRKLEGKNYTDAAVLNPIPLKEVIEAGYTDITVVLNNPRDYRMKVMGSPLGGLIGRLFFPLHGGLAKNITTERPRNFNQSYELAYNPPPGVNIRVIAPHKRVPKRMVDTNEHKLNEAVDLGVEAGYRMFADDYFLRKKKEKGLKARLGRLLGWKRISSVGS